MNTGFVVENEDSESPRASEHYEVVAPPDPPNVDNKNEPDPNQHQLPNGWVELWSDDRIPYYVYEPDGTTQ
jgi:hypothetical protein